MAESIASIVSRARAEAWESLAIIMAADFDALPAGVFRLSNLISFSAGNEINAIGTETHIIGHETFGAIFEDASQNLQAIYKFHFHGTDKAASEVLGQIEDIKMLKHLQLAFWGARFGETPAPGPQNILPDVIKLTNLEELSLNMMFSQVPKGIGQLSKLTKLDLSHNRLATVPADFAKLENLLYLDLAHNQLQEFPASILPLSQLQRLMLDDNQILEIPPEICQLSSLRTLRLRNAREVKGRGNTDGQNGNWITKLPLEISKLKNLESLDLRGNPIIGMPPEILEKISEPQAILSFYFDHLKQPLHEVKLLIVGQGSVGKTSLIQRLLHDKFNPAENKTDGIAISKWQVSDTEPTENSIRVNIWDFGGQEIMHATHQFFLTKRSLYLLVLDSRLTQEENRVEYWLKIIESFGGGSPVLIVGNKTDQHPLDVDRTGLRNKYPGVVDIVETSASSGAGIPELRQALASHINNLPHLQDSLPQSWFAVKAQIEEYAQHKNYISYDEYLSCCGKNDILTELSQETLVGFLHDLGVILHFTDDPRLEALGILNPEWVTNGVYRILNSHQLFQNQGKLTLDLLNEILDLPEYPRDKRLFIVDMMRRFELCYDIEPDKVFLVPDLLPKSEPFTGDWEDSLAFFYLYEVLPNSIISRFIVRMNAFIHKTLWRSGVVLKSNGNVALIKADTEDRKIYIWVSGDESTRRDFLSAIRTEFGAIHKTIPKLGTRQRVPVPGVPNISVDFEHLLTLERKGFTEIVPEGMDEPISVRHLLDGVSAPYDRREMVLETLHADTVQTSRVFYGGGTGTPGVATMPQAKPPSLVKRMLTIILGSVPRTIGRFVLDIFGRDKAADSSATILGYILLVIAVLVVWGILDLNSLVGLFTLVWRFFFPVK